MNIKSILEEIANEPGSNAKMDILRKYEDNELLKKVLYAAKSPRVKYYIKQIPEYRRDVFTTDLLSTIEGGLSQLSNREVTGNQASNHLADLLSTSTPEDAYVLERIIEKDLKIGMGTSNINKVFPKLIEKTPYMGARAFSEKLARDIITDKVAYSQIKMDGRYCNAIIEDGEVYLESRSGETTLITGSKIMHELSRFEDCVLNGELTIPGFDRNTANGIVNSVIGITTKLQNGIDPIDEKSHLYKRYDQSYEELLNKIVYTVWDRIDLDDYEAKKSDVLYNHRLFQLMNDMMQHQVENVEIVEHKIVTSYSEAVEHFKEALDRGLEGTILKSTDGSWKDGKPNWQIKMKLEIDLDMKIVGFNYGTKGTKNEHLISSLTVESSDGKIKTSPGGIKEKDMAFITTNQDYLMGKVIEMKCSGLSHDRDDNYSTLHPVFKYIRDDKHDADSFESAKEIENMAKSLSNS